jgi:hypothetical protein
MPIFARALIRYGNINRSRIMNQQARNAFFGNTQNFLRECTVSEGALDWNMGSRFLDRLVELEETHLHQWVGRYTVLVEIIRRARLAIESLDDEKDGTLEEVIGNERLETAAAEVADYLASLPRTYEYWAHLRGISGLDLSEDLEINEVLRLQRVQRGQDTERRLARALMTATQGHERLLAGFENGDTVLRIKVTGHSSLSASDSAPESALSMAKEFVVLASALDVLDTNSRQRNRVPTGLLTELPFDDYPNWVYGLPIHVSRHFDKYQLSAEMTHEMQGLFSPSPGTLVERSSEKTRATVAQTLARLREIFSPQANRHAIALRTAAQWCFDSLAEDNETNSYIFTSLGIEALLGGEQKETEGVGLKRLLANRLAFLLGGNRGQRESLIGEFEKFYTIRSNIVHGREPRLGYKERRMLSAGKRWLQQALGKELRLLTSE